MIWEYKQFNLYLISLAESRMESIDLKTLARFKRMGNIILPLSLLLSLYVQNSL